MNKEKLIDALMTIHAMCMDTECSRCCFYDEYGCGFDLQPCRYDKLIELLEDEA